MSKPEIGLDGVSVAYGEEREFLRCPRCLRAYELDQVRCPVDDVQLMRTKGRTLLGRVLANRYRIQEMLGSGGMGEVYRAWHLLLEKPLALKVVLPSVADRSAAVALLRREAKNASRVDHPNVVRVYDLELDGGILFLTMDFVAGPTLSEIVRPGRTLSPQLVSEIVDDVADGLEAIHAMGIVHRDLKPSNVIITRSRESGGVAKVLDFGISRAFDDPEQDLTRGGHVVGTPIFMSPEQRAGIPLDKRADVFALGVLTAFLINGSIPRIAAEDCFRLSDVPASAQWSNDLQDVLTRALMWERTQRTDSARRFASQLGDVMSRMPLGNGPHSIDDLLASGIWRVGSVTAETSTVQPIPTPEPVVNPGRTVAVEDDTPASTAPRVRHARTPVGLSAGIIAISGPLQGLRFKVGVEPVQIGRDPRECQVVFPESAGEVSRIHASISWSPSRRRFTLQDEGSKNATMIDDGVQIEPGTPVELDDGATFAVGHPDYRFLVAAEGL